MLQHNRSIVGLSLFAYLATSMTVALLHNHSHGLHSHALQPHGCNEDCGFEKEHACCHAGEHHHSHVPKDVADETPRGPSCPHKHDHDDCLACQHEILVVLIVVPVVIPSLVDTVRFQDASAVTVHSREFVFLPPTRGPPKSV
ncbi:MAG: hypothetical protein O3A00_27665 [Planctomycetota bacterium]|nr:hypothetical protein [Planctomycetota bacterium]